ncbi:MAG: Gliding motility protein GldN [uncultured Aureispira sp.]|uniref:Gliding motility protein GldN n=1 Tax=uncultured Aureispira sp. TaxID=1331704 RepID=A0A6S6U942_9BACT|nr:MAG: Gliding motility protein GldN [uncultured Aureispira sp.]
MNVNHKLLRFFVLGLVLTVIMPSFVWAQPDPNANVTESGNADQVAPRDNFYDRYLYTEKQVIPYDFIHEKDVFWERRIWRLIDIREKMNHPFKNEKEGESFIEILLAHAKAGDITLYHTFKDDFQEAMTQEEMQNLGSSVDTIITFDPETFDEIMQVVVNDLNPEDIKKYRLKEVYFFDEEKSSLDVRILGIAPIIDRVDNNGNFLNSGPMFWSYYPELRDILARHEAFNPHNDAARMSWEDIFEARLFSSYIIKESNVYDRRIKDYKTNPMDMLLESDKLKEQIFHFEHDLWSY